MKRSNPECKYYISEELCAAMPGRPEQQCHDDERGDCCKFVRIEPFNGAEGRPPRRWSFPFEMR